NPVVWWVRRELRTAQEACCDALVITRSGATRRVYAETLLQALEFIQAEGSLSPALASSFGGKSSTERRFEMIANPCVTHRLSWWSYPLLLAALAVLPCVPAPGQSDEPNDAEALERAYQFKEFPWRRDPSANRDLFPQNGLGHLSQPWDQPVPQDPLGRYPNWAGPDGIGSVRLSSHDILFGRQTHDYRLPDYLPATHGNAVSLGDGRYYVLTPKGSDRVWHVQFIQDSSPLALGGKILWDATLKLPPADELNQGDTFPLNTSNGIVTVAVVEDDYDNDRDIGLRQIDVKTGAVNDERTLLRHMARYQTFLEFMQAENHGPKENKDKAKDKEKEGGEEPIGFEIQLQPIELFMLAEAGKDGKPVEFEVLLQLGELQQQLDRAKKRERGESPGPGQQSAATVLRADTKLVGNDLILELESVDGANLIETALDLWCRVHGDTPVEQIRMSRDGGKVRIIIKGKSGSRPSGDHGEETEEQNSQGRSDGSAAEKDGSSGIPGSPADTPNDVADISIGPADAVENAGDILIGPGGAADD
ncbi:MAG: hypothetical protein KY475_15355, partial [Planctomycetes bacterium]|nr:hypothetical protein [Planctomycetota bacterium]